MRRVLRKTLKVLAVLAMLPIAAAAVLLAVANTGWGQAQIARLAGFVTAGTSAHVTIEGLRGRFPDRLAASRIAVNDRDGAWLTIDDAAISWSPLDLLRGRATIDAVAATRVAILRPPRPAEQAARSPESSGGLPVAVELHRLDVARLELPIVGARPMALALRGSGSLAGANARVRLEGDALDGVRGAYAIDAALDEGRINASVTAEEPAGEGFAARMGLPDNPSLTMQASLEGPVDGATAAIMLAAGALRVRGDGRVDLRHMAGALHVEASSPAMTPLDAVAWSSASLTLDLSGSLARPDVDATVEATNLVVGETALGHLRLAAVATSVAERIQLRFSAIADVAHLPGPAPDLLAAGPVEAAGSAVLAGGVAELSDLELRHPLIAMRAQARLDDRSLAGMVSLDVATLRPLLSAVGQHGDGSVQVEAALSGTVAAPILVLTGRGGITDGLDAARALLGPEVRLRATIVSDVAASRASVQGLRLEGTSVIVDADASASPEALAADWRIQFLDLAVLGTGTAGALDATGSATGRMDRIDARLHLASARLTRDAATLAPFAADIAVTGLPDAPAATLRIAGRMNDAPLLAVARAAMPRDGPWTATLEQATLPGLSAQGEMAGSGSAMQRATLALDASDLAPLGALLGMRMSGSATLAATAHRPAGSVAAAWPEATIEARLQDVALAGIGSIGTATLQAAVRETTTAPTASLQLAAQRVAAGGVILSTAQVQLEGPISALRARVVADGPEVAARLSGTIRANDGPTIELEPGSVRWRGENAALQAPARIVLGDGVRIDGLRLGLRGGRITADGRVGGAGNDLRATVAGLPLALAELAMPGTTLSGTVDGELRLSGTPRAPQGRLRASVRGARVNAGTARLLPAADATVDAALAGDSARVDATAQAGGGTQLRAQGRVPLDPSGTLDLRVTGALDLAMTDIVLAPQGRLMRGRATIDATARGLASRPALAGSVTIADGRLEDAVNGIRISALAGPVALRDETLRVGPLRGRIGGGEITLAGEVGVLAPGMPVDLRLVTRGGRVVDSPIATIAADAEIAVRGRLADELAASGPITVRRAEFRIAETLPPSLPTLQVREVGGTAQPRALTAAAAQASRPAPAQGARSGRRAPEPRPTEAAPPPAAGPRIALDIPIAIPGAVYVRGRGLDAQVDGDLRVRGTAAEPRVEGSLGLRRGTFEALGQRLTFRRGRLGFDPGAGIDPTLDLDATTASGGVSAGIHVGGRASAPSLTLTSDPPMPPDEIVSRMLFGSATSELTPGQMLRVASAVAELSGVGGGADVAERLRRGLGLDVLSVGDSPGGGVGAEAGRYVSEGVYVGVRSGRAPDGSQQTMGTVQIEVLPHVKIEAGVGTSGRVGVTYERDY